MEISWDKAYKPLQTMMVFEDVLETTENLTFTSLAYVQTDWCFEVDQMSCQNVIFFTQNNCLQGERTRYFNNDHYCVLHHRVNLRSCLEKLSAKNWLFIRSFISGHQKIPPVLKFLFPIYLTLYHSLISWTQAATTQYWTCDGPNRQLHVGRSADKRRWQRTLDSSRMDPAQFEVRPKCSYWDSYLFMSSSQQYASWLITKRL